MDQARTATDPGQRQAPADPVEVPGWDRPARSARLSEERQQEILGAAYSLLAEVGYEGLRFDAVAARAKASKATLYRHWSGKAELVAEAVRACHRSTVDTPDTGTLRGDLLALLGGMAEAMAGADGPLFAALLMAMRSDPEFARQMRGMRTAKEDLVVGILDRAIARGELTARPDTSLVDEIAPALMFMQNFAFGEPLDEAYLVHLVDDILLPLLTR